MKRIIFLLSIIAATSQAQVTNTVNISNSLLGPVTNVFTNTQVNVGEAIITGAVFNASVTNDIVNNISVTNDIQVGAVSVTNFVQTDISFTNIIENVAFTATNNIQVDPTIIITNVFTTIFDVEPDGTIVGKGNDGQRTIRPSTNNVADLGQNTNQWRKIYGVEILVDNVSLPPIPRVSPTEAGGVVLQYDPASTQYFWAGIGYPTPTFTGTNVATFTNNYVDSGDNALIWEVPVGVTNIAVHAWGAAGGGGNGQLGGAGGYVYAVLATVPGTVYEIIVGNGGPKTAVNPSIITGGTPGGGDGYLGISGVHVGAGGGYSGIKINNSTNFIVVAGAGAGGTNIGPGGNGGGSSGQTGQLSGSNVVIATGAFSSDFYGLNAVGGTNATGFGSGGFLQGGHAQANAFGSNVSGGLGGGGAGRFGGAAGGITAATGNGHSTGAGGSSYANPDYVTFAYSVRSPTRASAPVTDLPIYVSGRANGVFGGTGQPGLVVIQY